jgi:inosine-uridine nucleoside N-ribohydrolase
MAIRRIVLDTDIGTDPDDCLALALILASPELELVALTTVYGDVALRARIALKLLRLRGIQDDLPVAAGADRPLLRQRPVYWAGHEGQGLLDPGDEALKPSKQHAVDLIVEAVMARPGEIALVAIGPLTNVALGFLREPRLADSLAGMVLMGGVVGGAHARHLPRTASPERGLPSTEHNFRSDPEAAQIVLRAFPAGAPLTIVPLDVTTQVRIRAHDLASIRAAGDAYHQALAGQVSRYPPFIQRGWSYLHDPLAVAALIAPSLVTLEPLRAAVETGEEHTAGRLLVVPPTQDAPATADVALQVDTSRAERFILDRLAVR